MQVSNFFSPTEKAKQDGFNAYLTDKNAERLANALCRMRGAALKLGQMLSIQDEGVLPPQVCLCHVRRLAGCLALHLQPTITTGTRMQQGCQPDQKPLTCMLHGSFIWNCYRKGSMVRAALSVIFNA